MKGMIFTAAGILLVALTVLVTLKLIDDDDGGRTTTSPPPLVVIKDGGTVSKESMEKAGVETTETKPVDTERLRATYQVGKTYISTVKAGLTSKASYKDWGITSAMTINYASEFQISRYVVANDGKKMTVDVQVDRAQNITVFTSLDGVSIDLGFVAQGIMEIGGAWAGLPPGSSEVARGTVEKLLNLDSVKNYSSDIMTDEQAKVFAFVDEMQGKKARIVFENGKGVVSITAVGCSLSSDEQLFLEGLSMCSDITTMEKLDCKPGDTWVVAGKDFIPILDPSMASKVGGSVTVARGQDIDGGEAPEALLEIKGGVLKFNDRFQGENNKIHEHGSWAPKGRLIFNFGDKIITEAEMSGSVEFVQESVDHVLFEMKSVTRPVFQIQYSAWILDGDKLKETPKIKRTAKEGTLDALRRRMPVPR